MVIIGKPEIFNLINDIRTKYIPHLGITTNSGNSYSLNSTETIIPNQKFTVTFNVANTGASTLTIPCLSTAKGIKKLGGADATIKAGTYMLFYDGTNFQLLGEGGEYGNVTADKVLTGVTFGTENGIEEGTMPDRSQQNQIATAVLGQTQRIYLKPPEGYFGGANWLQYDDVNFRAENIPSGMSMFGLAGSMALGKKFATGSQVKSVVNGSGSYGVGAVALDAVTGLVFTPSFVIVSGIGTFSGTNYGTFCAKKGLFGFTYCRGTDAYASSGGTHTANDNYMTWATDGFTVKTIYFPGFGTGNNYNMTFTWWAFE